MREPFGWVKRVFGERKADILALFTPEGARHRHPVIRIAFVGAMFIGLAAAGAVGIASLAGLLFAVGVIYFLSTKVLGLQIDVDPRAFYERVQREAAAYGPN